MNPRVLPYHAEATAPVHGAPAQVFEYLDDPIQLTGHMQRRSAMMLGSRMSVEMDAQFGREVGSVIRLAGRVLGIPIALEEVITEREPLVRKAWETTGTPRLLVISHYRMGFELRQDGDGCQVRVTIDYQRPERGFTRLLGALFGAWYARWCTRRMAQDARRHFER